MGKEIGLLRHGKSDWSSGAETDHDRPLKQRGIEAARLMGRYLARVGRAPEAVFSSSAVRARRTAELAVEEGRWDCPVEVTRRLYATDSEQVFELLRGVDENVGRVVLVGHNPTWEEFLGTLVGGGHFKLSTASLAWTELATARWADCRPGSGVLRWLVTPKLLDRLNL